MTNSFPGSADEGREQPGSEILLVDDMPEIGIIVKRLGRRFGHQVVQCFRAEEAWKHLGERHPDLVLLDLNLPGISGLEFCRRLRAEPALAGLPVAVLSAGLHPEEQEAARAAGANFFLDKELLARPDALQRRLEEILRPGKAGTANGSGQ